MPSSSSRRSAASTYGRGVEHAGEVRSIKPPRRRRGGDSKSLVAFFNKRLGFFLLWASLLLLAGHGGKGEKKGGVREKMLSSYPGGVVSASLEWKSLMLFEAPWWSSSASRFDRCLFNKLRFWVLRRAVLLRLPPPARGRSWEFDGGPVCTDGVGGEPSAARYFCFSCLIRSPAGAEVAEGGDVDWASSSAKQQWSWEAIFMSTTSAAGHGRPTSKAYPRPIQKPVKGSGVCLTSLVRPLSRSAAASFVCMAASGSVPASTHDGGVADLRLDGGEREGSDCVFGSVSQVLSANTRDLYVNPYFMGSFVIICTSTVWNQ